MPTLETIMLHPVTVIGGWMALSVGLYYLITFPLSGKLRAKNGKIRGGYTPKPHKPTGFGDDVTVFGKHSERGQNVEGVVGSSLSGLFILLSCLLSALLMYRLYNWLGLARDIIVK